MSLSSRQRGTIAASTDTRRRVLMHDTRLLLCRVTLVCPAAEVFDGRFGRHPGLIGSWSHRSTHAGYEKLKNPVVQSNPYLSHGR